MKTSDLWSAVQRILCIRLDALGDVLMTTPALAALKGQAANRHLTLLTSASGGAVAPLLPMIDETIQFDSPWMKATTPRSDSSLDRQMIDRLAQGRYDAAVVFTVYSQTPFPAALLCYLANIPLRLAHARENPYKLLTHWVPESEPEQFVRHEVQRQLDLVATIGATIEDTRLVVRLTSAARQKMRRRLTRLGLHGRAPRVVIHPGASVPSRRYPPEGFAAVAGALVREQGCQVLLTGSAGERELVAQIQQDAGVPTLSLAGETNVEELAALLAESSLLVSNNTGPVHLAAAVGTPVVDLYALTNLQHTPWQVPHEVLFHDVPCRNCYKSVCPQEHHHCLRLVRPEAVVRAACRLLRRQFSDPAPGPAEAPMRPSAEQCPSRQ
jgi:lipopolysaccharide heptosyltransferase II